MTLPDPGTLWCTHSTMPSRVARTGMMRCPLPKACVFYILKPDHLKCYIHALEGRSRPCDYYSENPIPHTDDTHIVQQVVDYHYVGQVGARG